MNILEREKLTAPEKPKEEEEEEEAPECLDTKLVIWDDDEFEELEVDFLNQVYPEKINKNTVTKGAQVIFHFLNSSLHYWVEFKDPEEVEPEKMSQKDAKYLSTVFSEKNCDNFVAYNRWGQNFNKRQQFMKKEAEEKNYKIPEGETIYEYSRGVDKFIVNKYKGSNASFTPYKERFEILFLLYIDGVSFVKENTDEWEYYVIFKKREQKYIFIGVLSMYIFRLTSVKERHRISQVLILPNYQNQGHGKELLDIVYDDSLKNEKCFELTTQIPSFEYQCLRDFKESQLILKNNIFDLRSLKNVSSKNDIEMNQNSLLHGENIRQIKSKLKIPGHQIERLANLFVYASILNQKQNQISRAIFEEETRQRIIYNRSAFKSRKKIPHITFNGCTSDMKEFFLQKAKEDHLRNQAEIEEILAETLDGYRRVIAKMRKNKVLNLFSQ